MSDGINLLKETEKKPVRNDHSLLIVRILSVLSISILALVAIVVFFLKSTSAIPKLKKEESDAFSEFASLSEKRTKLIIAQDRFTNISDIISRRPKFEEKIDFVLSHVPADITVDSMSLSNSKITFSLTTSSLAAVDQLFNNLIDTTLKKKGFTAVSYDYFNIDLKNSSYSLSIALDTI